MSWELVTPLVELERAASNRTFAAEFSRDRKDLDAFHWAEGEISISRETIPFHGRLTPGPDYKLYLSPEFVETETEFMKLKPQMALVGDANTFDNFIVALPRDTDPSKYNTAIVWCESFGQFITSAKYQTTRN